MQNNPSNNFRDASLPEFNAGLAYLYRLNNLTIEFERCILDGEVRKGYNTLRLLQSEVLARARMKSENDIITKLDEKKKTASSAMDMSAQIDQSLVLGELLDWFDTINESKHKLQLELQDKAGGLSATRS